jgi:hypothetical protein
MWKACNWRSVALGAALVMLMVPAAFAQQMVPSRFQVFFDWNKATLTPEAQRTLTSAAEEFKRTGVVRIEAVGHTDTSGSAQYNLRLSERRADAVKAALVNLGVPAYDIVTKGVGQTDLLVPTPDGVRELKNRRVEIFTPAKPVAEAAPPPPPPAAPPPPPPPPAPKKWSVSLGPWYGYSLKETDRDSSKTSSLVGPQLNAEYAITPEWSVGVSGTGFNSVGTSAHDGFGGRGALLVTHYWNIGDWHPYIGPNVGYIGGAGVQDGGFAGPRVGVKYDVNQDIYVYAQAGYDKLFRNDFDKGVVNGTIGLGHRF